ncbi:MAG: peptidoglycan DD-metalloendopeptidase family protein [Bacteroidales bacterium]|jgi:tetratricopeptide (TPR) repeat protein|nr:peptidoglycan DD-metalloendopeptidase family protein [Bacteroidales bacterium]
MVLEMKYIISVFFICLSMQLIAKDKIMYSKQTQVDTCFPELKIEHKSLLKAIDKINMNYSDNYLHTLSVYNYHLNANENTKQWEIISSVLSKIETAIEKEKEIIHCPNIAEIYTMKAIALLYRKNYTDAYQLFDRVVRDYKNTTSWMNAYLWLAHTSIYMEKYDTTRLVLQSIAETLDTTNMETLVRYEILSADLSLKTFDDESALNHLLKVEQMPLSRKNHTRIKFIIAQVYTQTGKYKEAIPYYNKIIKPLCGADNLMKSYAVVYKHFCERLIEIEEEQTYLALENAKKENISESKEFEPTIVESYHDSSYIYMDYPYYFNDVAAMFFLDESIVDKESESFDDEDSIDYIDDYSEMHLSNEMLETIFENWDSISIHIPKTDFSSMTDTIYLPLTEAGTAYSLPHFNPILSRFGWRRYRYHYGVDTKNSVGDSILCVFDGIVRIAKRNRTYGNVIIVRHYNGLETFYAHCSKLLVEQNQEVKAGELIALVGSTGRSTGPHLHFETRYKGAAFNPEYMIDFENGKLISDTLMITKETFNYRRSGNSSATSPSPADAVYYKIRSGDTLSVIARKYRTTVNNIKRLNGLKSDFIRDGQRIRVL